MIMKKKMMMVTTTTMIVPSQTHTGSQHACMTATMTRPMMTIMTMLLLLLMMMMMMVVFVMCREMWTMATMIIATVMPCVAFVHELRTSRF